MLRVLKIMALLAVVAFATYYQYAFMHFDEFPNINPIYYNLSNWTTWTCLGFVFVYIGRKSDSLDKFMFFYPIGFFWLYLVLIYITNYVLDDYIVMHKVVYSIVFTFLTVIICYSISSLRRCK